MKKRAFVKYTKKGQIIPGSLIVTTKGGYPKDGLYEEVSASLFSPVSNCVTPDYGTWKAVVDGDGIILNDAADVFTIIGTNDSNNDGWSYLKRFFPDGAQLTIPYHYMAFDGLDHDYPVYWTSSTEPTGEPDDTSNRAGDNPDTGTWNVTVNPGEWFAIGIYSDDSCCGRGFLSVELNVSAPVFTYFANYSTVSGPAACYQAQDQFNIYTAQTIALSSEVFSDSELSAQVNNGYYSVGGTIYTVSSGVVTAVNTCPATSAYSYVISGTDLALATGNTDTNKNGKIYATTTDDGSGSAASRTFSSPGSYNHWICSADPIVPTFGYYASDVLVTVGLVSTQTNIGNC